MDAVVYSPIRNKGEWNTSHLEERCRQLGIKTVTYPWLQWNGYFTNVAKPENLPPHLWCLAGLIDLLEEGASLEQLLHEAEDGARFKDAAGPYSDYSFSELRKHEADIDIKISGFIEQEFRNQRLFLTPDHPTSAMYAWVCTQIADRLGVGIAFDVGPAQLHKDVYPILPSIAAALGLNFSSTEFAIERPSIGPLALDQYLRRLRSDYVAVNGERTPAQPESPQPAVLPSSAPAYSSRHPSPNLREIRPEAPAVVRVVHELEFGGLSEKPYGSTVDACRAAVDAARSGRHYSVTVRSEGHPFSISDIDAAELLTQWSRP
ncbi:MAG: hypothetical protein EOP24_40055 [Hyphomicrobiales bacterium]|nr:MAG: hypothetical protein EOP24_40055 [Hyphomicrobiales bacterium]